MNNDNITILAAWEDADVQGDGALDQKQPIAHQTGATMQMEPRASCVVNIFVVFR